MVRLERGTIHRRLRVAFKRPVGRVTPWTVVQALPSREMRLKAKRAIWGPITPEKVLEWWGVLYREWVAKRDLTPVIGVRGAPSNSADRIRNGNTDLRASRVQPIRVGQRRGAQV